MVLNMVSSPRGKEKLQAILTFRAGLNMHQGVPQRDLQSSYPPYYPLSITWMFPMIGSKHGFNHLENSNQEQEQMPWVVHLTGQGGFRNLPATPAAHTS